MTAITTAAPDAAKRDAILEQAIVVFADEGFRNADVQRVADNAGVGKGTVYRYFGNKQDLFWAAVMSVLERLDARMIESVERVEQVAGAAGKIRASCIAYAAFFEANPRFLEVFVQERAEFRGAAPETHLSRHETMIDRFAEIIDEGVARGEFRPLDSRQTIVSLGGTIYGTVLFGCFDKTQHTLTEMAAYTVDIFLEGIRADAV
jgi:AcrR family transcriptional regulator